jgi:hypothetical protein
MIATRNKYTKWTPDRLEKLRHLAAGMSIRDIAVEFSTTPCSIWAICKEKKIPCGRRYLAWSQERCETVRAMATGGYTKNEAANRIGCSIAAVKRAAYRLGVRFKGKGGAPRRIDWEKVQELAASGVWIAQACRLLQMHHSAAIYISKQMGFKWPLPPKQRPRLLPSQRIVRRDRKEDSAVVDRMMVLAERCSGGGA